MGDEFIFHLFNWQIICAPIQQRGLGVREVLYFNKALLGKWLRQFAMEEQALWRTVVARKCGCEWGGWSSKEVWGGHGFSLWKFIRFGWELFSRYINFEVGHITKVRWSCFPLYTV